MWTNLNPCVHTGSTFIHVNEIILNTIFICKTIYGRRLSCSVFSDFKTPDFNNLFTTWLPFQN